jgi:hypothetical protein
MYQALMFFSKPILIMKLYTFNGGWRGFFMTIANSKDEAYINAQKFQPYCINYITSPQVLTELEIIDGLTIEGGGDY